MRCIITSYMYRLNPQICNIRYDDVLYNNMICTRNIITVHALVFFFFISTSSPLRHNIIFSPLAVVADPRSCSIFISAFSCNNVMYCRAEQIIFLTRSLARPKEPTTSRVGATERRARLRGREKHAQKQAAADPLSDY